MFEENWIYRIVVIVSLCVLLAWVYVVNEASFTGFINGKPGLDAARLAWHIGIFILLAVALVYLMQSVIDYKGQNDVLRKYLQRLQQELDVEREAIKQLKTESNDELLRLESFIITMSDTAKQISSVLRTDELLRVLLRKAIDLLGSQKCVIFKVDEKTQKLVYIDSVGYKKEEIEGYDLKADEKSGLIGYASEQGIFVSRKTLAQDYTKAHIVDGDKLKANFCQPIVYNSKTLASICVGTANPDLTHEQVMRLLSTLANFGGIALTNTELVDKIREQSVRDSLTWLYNHQYFQNYMNHLLSVAKRERDPLGFIMMDIDFFKKFNDTYGHQAGDFVLKKVASMLTAELRGTDIVARYGGEEFVAILPGRDAEASYKIADRIRKLFEGTLFNYESHELKITLSAGVSAYIPSVNDTTTKELLIRYADNALYEAKAGGRNKVVIHKINS
ncbi:MAG: sensor domain-containing diguanylate cyclase [Candidatus Omnitrophica bacterium]|nr:sensor domain-containing diguanylate cyclase [Candidatus Omnitrophota bacterium]